MQHQGVALSLQEVVRDTSGMSTGSCLPQLPWVPAGALGKLLPGTEWRWDPRE